MTSFPNSPRLMKDAIVGVDAMNPLASVVIHYHSDGLVSNGLRQQEEKELRVGWIGRKELMTEADVSGNRERTTQVPLPRQRGLLPFLEGEKGTG